MIELQQFLTVRYTNDKTESMCCSHYRQIKAEGGDTLRIVASETPNSKCDVCERLERFKQVTVQ